MSVSELLRACEFHLHEGLRSRVIHVHIAAWDAAGCAIELLQRTLGVLGVREAHIRHPAIPVALEARDSYTLNLPMPAKGGPEPVAYGVEALSLQHEHRPQVHGLGPCIHVHDALDRSAVRPERLPVQLLLRLSKCGLLISRKLHEPKSVPLALGGDYELRQWRDLAPLEQPKDLLRNANQPSPDGGDVGVRYPQGVRIAAISYVHARRCG
mmetsp:Transcript_65677/g.146580  ORF Transcript_65677/g.146580 Transcript_65677/m.146580 type:complete len:211 (+) Transcript_65677:369-1001(+)|eukprot:CAMPEP_0181185904 /NCGR_PEP_ID=MMETSP1096-20121128/9756_1 /TAXON_ID=156174 ORGANISM="Chrysochromulina ericina, Strain CCMP281" /NCGR_SAMPLE_ID=MMETSP1096 /ASSEMBLY_ACC=CAM_ASM_000453 /LENGTH=210 /DNA_ID=CAMNT_0023274779 /DNA_START=304 /DNA_END=936 /DNA_ORIENTATION=-